MIGALSVRRLVAALALLAPLAARGADGNLDLSFHGDGRATLVDAVAEVYLSALVEAPDGRLVVSGSRRSGSPNLHTAFWTRLADSSASTCDLPPPAGTEPRGATFLAAAFDAAGRLLVGGWYNSGSGVSEILVARYLYPDCAPDPSFGSGGLARFEPESATTGNLQELAADGDGVVAVGSQWTGGSDATGFVLRLDSEGELDPGFGSGGRIAIDRYPGHDWIRSVAVAPGRIYVGGYGLNEAHTASELFVAAYESDGDPLPGWGADGAIPIDFGTTELPAVEVLEGIVLDAEGRLVVAGTAGIDLAPGSAGALARLLPTGELDPDFGNGGTRVDASRARFDDLAVQGDGRIVVVSSDEGDGTDFRVARKLENGSPDPTFAGGSWVPISFAEGGEHYQPAIALQAGRPALVGILIRASAVGPDLGAVARMTSAYLFADGFDSTTTSFWSGAVE